jgi:hypothetical protein
MRSHRHQLLDDEPTTLIPCAAEVRLFPSNGQAPTLLRTATFLHISVYIAVYQINPRLRSGSIGTDTYRLFSSGYGSRNTKIKELHFRALLSDEEAALSLSVI